MIRKLALVAACALAALGTAGTALADAPAPTSPPAIPMASYVHVGYTLTALKGTWPGTGLSFKYQWKQCNGDGASCVDIAKATGLTYKPVVGDANETLEFAVTATNSAKQSTTVTTAASSVVGNSAPDIIAVPMLTGSYVHPGYTLTATNGSWSAPSAGLAFTYQWQQCSSVGQDCADIKGATAATFKLPAGSADKTFRVGVKATNPIKQVSAVNPSAVSSVVSSMPPSNGLKPAVTAPYVHVGYLFTATSGSWNTPNATFKYQWERCDLDLNCTKVAGATAATYKAVAADAGTHLHIAVTAADVLGVSSTAYSDPTNAVANAAPVNSDAPTMTAPYAHVGYLFSASKGGWDAPNPTIKYQWLRCDGEGANCANIAGATASNYKAAAADGGKTLRVLVNAANAVAVSTGATSAAKAVSAAGPENTDAPRVTVPFAHVGYTITASTGGWAAPLPLKFKYQWQRCDGSSCANIAGATQSTYKPVAADGGKTLRLLVTAVDSAGTASAPAASEKTDVISNDAPAIVDDPVVSGFAHVGYTLTTTHGSWDTPNVTVKYQWYACPVGDGPCTPIKGATAATYKPVAADTNRTVFAAITAVNAIGQPSSQASTDDTDPVSNNAPSVVEDDGLPTLGGDALVGQTLTATAGIWDTPNLTYLYQWQRCTWDGVFCLFIEKQFASTYKVTSADVGFTIRALVSATNAVKQTSAKFHSPRTDVVVAEASAPTYGGMALGIDTGTPAVGDLITAHAGNWTGSPYPHFSYQWYSCSPDEDHSENVLDDCTAIDGATESSYVVADSDLGTDIRVQVTGTNLAGSDSFASFPTQPVQSGGSGTPSGPPQNMEPVWIQGPDMGSPLAVAVGDTFAIGTGWWDDQSATFGSYAWYICATDDVADPSMDESCVRAGSAPEYTPIAGEGDANVGLWLYATVTATNDAGSTVAWTPYPKQILEKPAPIVMPSMEGSATVGGMLMGDYGTWDNNPNPVAYWGTWELCDDDGNGSADLSSCVSLDDQFYGWLHITIDPSWVGKHARFGVTAVNDAGKSDIAWSDPTAQITA